MMRTLFTAPGWVRKGEAYAIGEAFLGGRRLGAEMLAEEFSKIGSEAKFKDTIDSLDGIFCVLMTLPTGEILATTGIANASQLFYKEEGDNIVFSDDAYALAGKDFRLNRAAAREYQLQAYIHGDATLAEGVYKVEPYKYLIISGKRAEQKAYYDYALKKGEANDAPREELRRQCDAAFDAAFERAVQQLKGKQAVIPLSGGLDSRLMACMLKKHGIDDVICYTAGDPENYEVSTARRVAAKLGYKHYSYANDDFSIDPQNEKHRAYLKYVCNLCNMPWTFEYRPASILVEKGIIPAGAVFMPGHSGDVLAGSLATLTDLGHSASKKKTAVRLASARAFKKFDRSLTKSVLGRFPPDFEAYEAYGLAESFLLREWIAKNTLTSCRLYKFLGCDILLPYFDRNLLEFFKHLPLEHKIEENFYFNHLKEGIFKEFGVDFSIQQPAGMSAVRKQWKKDRIKSLIPASILQKILPEPKDKGVLGSVNDLLIKDLYSCDANPSLYTNLQNERNLLWYVKRCGEL